MTPPTPPRDPVRCSATPGLLSEGPRRDADRRELQWVDFIGSLLATVPLPVDRPTSCGGTSLNDGPAPVRTLARAASHTVQIPERGYVKVGHDLRSSLPHVFAAEDINGISMLVPARSR